MSTTTPAIHDRVIYATDQRNGLVYDLPAIVTVTRASHPGDYPCEECDAPDCTYAEAACCQRCADVQGQTHPSNPLPVPSTPTHVHLTVFSPGGFGAQVVHDEGFDSQRHLTAPDSDDFPDADVLVPGSGTYVEWDVGYGDGPRSWRWMDDRMSR